MPGAIFVCPCLNIQIQAFEVYPDSKFPGFVEEGDEINGSKAVDITYRHPGLSILYHYLTVTKQYYEWTVYQCLNCNTYTHAVRCDVKGRNMAAVNSKLKVNEADVIQIKSSPNYSRVYHIVLYDKERRGISELPTQCEKALTAAANQCQSFVTQDEAEMEERIQLYMKQQQQEHDKVTLQAEMDSEVMERILMYAAAMKQEEQPSPARHRPLSKAFSTDDSVFLQRDQENGKKAADQIRKRKSRKQEDNDELLMFMEEEEDWSGFDEREDEAVDEEDYNISESDSSADAPCTDRKIPKRQVYPQQHSSGIYSSSMPMDIPSMDKLNKNVNPEAEETPDPDNMGASIMKLAESVRDGSRYIFGDRPRPRLNTGDFHYTKRT